MTLRVGEREENFFFNDIIILRFEGVKTTSRREPGGPKFNVPMKIGKSESWLNRLP